jgi:CPA1 family monovalent cation:H+ antiporter
MRMSLFESILALLAIAVVLMQWARRLRVPYPALLALAGGCVAGLPFAPQMHIQPQLALALFVAPAVMDTAFDIPPRELLRNWLPLVSLAVLLVLVTTATVAFVGIQFAHLPVAAALALGAIVAPPDAAAASAMLREFDLPRRMVGVLQGESLLNDAMALLVFGIAVSVAQAPGDPWGHVVPRLAVAVPAGTLFGIGVGVLSRYVFSRLGETLSFVLVQFLVTYGTWLAADRLGLSPIMAVVALAAVAARYAPARTSARGRINTNAVWSIVVFVLNVLAFLLMGLQARTILTELQAETLRADLQFAAIVLAVVIGVRFAWVMTYGLVLRRFRRFFETHLGGVPVPQPRIGVLVSWCGMRGLVTLATAFALPQQFPRRDLIVLSAFTVVLGTLVVQGFTIRPLIAMLRIEPDRSADEEVSATRRGMLDAALAELQGVSEEGVELLRAELSAERDASNTRSRPVTSYDLTRLRAVAAARRYLIERRQEGQIFDDTYHRLEDELDRVELHAASLETTWLDG